MTVSTRIRNTALALVAVAGAFTFSLAAEPEEGPVHPPGIYQCYKNLYTCSYVDSDAYWNGCDVDQDNDQLIYWWRAESICTMYHPN